MDKTLLNLYTGSLLSSFRFTTATNMTNLLKDTISRVQITCFLSTCGLVIADTWNIVMPLLR